MPVSIHTQRINECHTIVELTGNSLHRWQVFCYFPEFINFKRWVIFGQNTCFLNSSSLVVVTHARRSVSPAKRRSVRKSRHKHPCQIREGTLVRKTSTPHRYDFTCNRRFLSSIYSWSWAKVLQFGRKNCPSRTFLICPREVRLFFFCLCLFLFSCLSVFKFK